MNLRFEVVDDGCCLLCNPIALADHEQPCVRVTLVGSVVPAREFCGKCLAYLRAMTGVAPGAHSQEFPITQDVARLVRAKPL